jgi:hypothetical protein
MTNVSGLDDFVTESGEPDAQANPARMKGVAWLAEFGISLCTTTIFGFDVKPTSPYIGGRHPIPPYMVVAFLSKDLLPNTARDTLYRNDNFAGGHL